MLKFVFQQKCKKKKKKPILTLHIISTKQDQIKVLMIMFSWQLGLLRMFINSIMCHLGIGFSAFSFFADKAISADPDSLNSMVEVFSHWALPFALVSNPHGIVALLPAYMSKLTSDRW